MKRKILYICLMLLIVTGIFKTAYAATVSISAKTSATVGDKVTVTVKWTAAAWNLSVSGDASGSLIDYNSAGENVTKSATYTITSKTAGTKTIYITGDITDENEKVSYINKSITVTFKEKATTNTNANTNKNSSATTNTTTTQKSSNANISKLTLNVEGLSFNKTDTVYNISVGADVENIIVGVSLESSKATYTVTGNKGLKAGNNVIKIVVTAEDGTKKTYKINVEKDGNIEDTSADLTNLIIEGMTFNTPFDTTITEYVGNKIKYTNKLNVFVYTKAEEATYEIVGSDNLKSGENKLVIKVTSKDKTNTKEYMVTFEMMEKEEEDALQTISIYAEKDKKTEKRNEMWEIIKDNSTIILLYILALIEFAQVVYLYIQLKNVNPDAVEVKVRRRKQQK